MKTVPSLITFYQRFEADILSGKKTITIRDESEKHYRVGTRVKVHTYEDQRWFCDVEITQVSAIQFEQLTELHAEQENMTLAELRAVIREIYPGVNDLYVISYKLV